jgi:holo-[acyl-carrier protein] synthase
MQIGIDIVKISRFRNKKYNINQNFYKKIFTTNEIKYCLKYKDPYTHFAGKFAAKEAIIKATQKKIQLNQIEIKNKKKGLEIITKNKIESDIHISISHETDYAVAMCVIETIIKNRF